MTSSTDRLTLGSWPPAAASPPRPCATTRSSARSTPNAPRARQRRYPRATLRRVAFTRAAQQAGLTLDEAAAALSRFPSDRAPTATQWSAVASTRTHRIADLERLKRKLTGCIGCGCLSLRTCALCNPSDTASTHGPGARYLLGDTPPPPAHTP
ncbi:MerR family DNA-binding protein [Streptomyces sp. NPDC021098]|uniref:MerR family DNA-binding protein n=1 Tax=unclassified Streptomyces TaxID=2593676 RepID=UPI003799006C